MELSDQDHATFYVFTFDLVHTGERTPKGGVIQCEADQEAIRNNAQLRADEANMAPNTSSALRKMPLDRVVDLSRADLISHDTDTNRQTGSRIHEGFHIDPHVLRV